MELVQVIGIGTSIIFLIIVFRLVIKKQLREEFCIIWIACAVVINIFAFWRKGIDVLANFFGVHYPPSLIFIAFFFALIIYCLHLSIIISKQRNDIKNLTQEVSLINQKLSKINLI
jgi:hypothetical protein